jgi:RHS repeat-associated protein
MTEPSKDNLYQYNGKEYNADHNLKWSDYGARWYDAVLGRWSVPDPMGEKYMGWNPYNYGVNNPVRFIDPDGMDVELYNHHDDKLYQNEQYSLNSSGYRNGFWVGTDFEPARNKSGTIEQTIQQWIDKNSKTIDDIQNIIRGEGGIRYIYTEKRGWIDLSHYVLVQQKGKFLTDLLEPVSGNILFQLLLGEDADRSYYSYEDKPSNKFSSEVNLNGLKGDALFKAIYDHFISAGATYPEAAPNWLQIPFDDHDRSRLPEKLIYAYSSGATTTIPNIEVLKTGRYIPQNRSHLPYPLFNFPAAATSLQKRKK